MAKPSKVAKRRRTMDERVAKRDFRATIGTVNRITKQADREQREKLLAEMGFEDADIPSGVSTSEKIE